MDDAKLANGPVKVRCAKCKEVFVVAPEEPEVPAVAAPVAPAAAPSEDIGFSFDSPPNDSADFSFGDQPASSPAESSAAHQGPADEFDWQSGFDPKSPDDGFDISSPTESSQGVTPSPPASGDFSMDNDFDFSDTSLAASADAGQSQPAAGSGSPSAEDFSMDFGEVSFASTSAAEQPAARNVPDDAAFSFDQEDTAPPGDFSLSFSSDPPDQTASVPNVPPVDEPAENVNFGEFSFGEIDAREDADKGGDFQSAAAVSATAAGAAAGMFAAEATFNDAESGEAPPASITTRKKRGGIFPLFVILGAVVLIIALIGSGVYFFSGPKAFSKVGLGFLVEWYGDKGGEEGNITLKNVTATYVVNSAAGELFVVKGEAVNNFKKPRASVQVKVSVLGPGGAALLSKSAYCGNSLSAEQLATLPAAKLDEIMNNQFGDSLANLGLKPGAAIPFVIAVSQVPKEASDYSVQVSGSTVAAQQ